MELVIGTKRWSSWSMRPWLALKRTGAPFTETLISLRQQNDMTREMILPHSPSGLVPCLKTDDLVLVDSLAICEYLNEAFPEARLWPLDRAARALGRSAAAEMHAGFAALRGECPMALELAPRPQALSDAARRDVARVVQIWSELLERSAGPYLLGEWSIADAFYTPVATRFRTYQVELTDYGAPEAAVSYCHRLLETPEFRAWEQAALHQA